MATPVPGWYQDPTGGGGQRFWDGARWTDTTRPAGAAQGSSPGSAAGSTAESESVERGGGRRGALIAGGVGVLVVAIAVAAVALTGGFGGDAGDEQPLAAAKESNPGTAAMSGDGPTDDHADGIEGRDDHSVDNDLDEAADEPVEELREPPPPLDRPLVLGYLAPQTGMLAFLGPEIIAGIDLAVEEINEGGGIGGQPVILHGGDEADDAAIGRGELERLLDLGVDAIVGPATTRLTLEFFGSVTEAGVVQCSPAATGTQLTSVADGGLLFRTVPSEALAGAALAEVVHGDGHRRASVVVRDDENSLAVMDQFTSRIEALGGTVVTTSLIDADGPASPASAAIVGADDVDVIVLLTFDDAEIAASLVGDGVAGERIYAGAGGVPGDLAAVDGVTVITPASQAREDFSVRVQEILPSTGNPTFAVPAYDCVMLIALAAAAAGDAEPLAFSREINDLTNGTSRCAGFRACAVLVGEGRSIAYESAGGDVLAFLQVREGSGDPSRGRFEVLRSTGDGVVVVDEVVAGLDNG